MNRDPQAWAILGRAIRDDRNRQGLTRPDVVARVNSRGADVTTRTIGSIESGTVPKRDQKPPTLEPVVVALGWKPGYVDRILNGEDPSHVLAGTDESPAPQELPTLSPRQAALELLPEVYEFTRAAIEAGGDPALRDEVETAARNLIASIPGRPAPGRSTYDLVAYRPHGAGEPVPNDDVERIQAAMHRGR